ncbi:uncharacterized protein [Misgurnus anguillicaudatus]|uniref:uncharacterized protein n=1 Tax=Misgurnus anguillicaudatus TaxID=75329 RepID=UPI003CCF8BB1
MESHKVLDHPNTFVLLQSHRLSLKDPRGGHLKTLRVSTPQIAIDKEITMIKDIMKEKDPHVVTGRIPALIADTTHYLKMVRIRGDEKKKPVTTLHLIRIRIAGIKRAAWAIIQRRTHLTPAITEIFVIVEGKAKTRFSFNSSIRHGRSHSRSSCRINASQQDEYGRKRKYKTKHLEKHQRKSSGKSYSEPGEDCIRKKLKEKKHNKKSKKKSRSPSTDFGCDDKSDGHSRKHHKKRKKHRRKGKRDKVKGG